MPVEDYMAEEAVVTEHEPEQTGESVEGQESEKRDKSTIKFAYLPLDDAIAIATGVHQCGGSCQIDQLAATLNQKPATGSFRLKLITTKLFGLITYSQRSAELTPLGARICDSQQQQQARADAFLNVPLYSRVYEQFKGVTLPPPSGLESVMVSMGVAPKQKTTARQVFARSASQAGFLWSGDNRLVMPVIRSGSGGAAISEPTKVAAQGEHERKHGGGAGGGTGGGGGDDPAIRGLIQRLPAPETDWPLEKQAKWLLALSHAFDVIYPRDDDARTMKIEIVSE